MSWRWLKNQDSPIPRIDGKLEREQRDDVRIPNLQATRSIQTAHDKAAAGQEVDIIEAEPFVYYKVEVTNSLAVFFH